MRWTLNNWSGRFWSCNFVPSLCKLPETWIQPLCVSVRGISHGCICRVSALSVPVLPFWVSRPELPRGTVSWAWTSSNCRTQAEDGNLAVDSPSAARLCLHPPLPSHCPLCIQNLGSPHTCFVLLSLRKVPLLLDLRTLLLTPFRYWNWQLSVIVSKSQRFSLAQTPSISGPRTASHRTKTSSWTTVFGEK